MEAAALSGVWRPEWDPWSQSVVVDQLCERTGTLGEVWRRFLVEKPWGFVWVQAECQQLEVVRDETLGELVDTPSEASPYLRLAS